MSSHAITESLEAVAEKCGDPTPLVYARVFATYPQLKPLFIMDRDDSVKGNMLSQVIECFLDFDNNRHYAAALISSEKINHENLGIPPDAFTSFFQIIVDTFKDILDEAWTDEYETAWNRLIADLTSQVNALA